MTLGQRITQYRKQLGISQEELGERLGVSRQAVSKWETGVASPDMENLLALAREFDVSVAELTDTPRGPAPVQEYTHGTDPPSPSFRFRKALWPTLCGILAVVLIVILALTFWMNPPQQDPNEEALDTLPDSLQPGQVQDPPAAAEVTTPVLMPETDFALIWSGANGNEEFLELGVQNAFFPFGTTLEETAPKEVVDTDFHLTDLHKTVCGAIQVNYLHIEEDLEYDPKSLEQERIIGLSTIAPSVHTPRGIHVGSTKADVAAAYGDELVYCLKEEDSYTLVQHDYYYVYQPASAFSRYLAIYMRDGLVAGLWVEDLIDGGNDWFDPDYVHRFPTVSGEPDFSQRTEPEQENRSDTWQVYHAWNQLVTNNNLSAEELYTYRWTVFSLLSEMDWQEFGSYGFGGSEGGDPSSTIGALMQWLNEQAPYTEAEILRLQMGCAAKGLDGAYTDMYCHLLSTAFFNNPYVFVKGLAHEGLEDTMSQAIGFTAYDAELYPVELERTLASLDASIKNGSFTEAEQGWAKLLRLYLITPINNRSELPKTPAELE